MRCIERAGRSQVSASGFSLIEMLVAMAVFGLAVLALLHLAGENVRSAALVEERVLAGVVADNRAVEAALVSAAELQAAPTSGIETTGDRRWRWHRQVVATDMDGVVRIEIGVAPETDEHLAAEASVFRSLR